MKSILNFFVFLDDMYVCFGTLITNFFNQVLKMHRQPFFSDSYSFACYALLPINLDVLFIANLFGITNTKVLVRVFLVVNIIFFFYYFLFSYYQTEYTQEERIEKLNLNAWKICGFVFVFLFSSTSINASSISY